VFSTGFFRNNFYLQKPFFNSDLARFKTQVRLVLFYFGAEIFMSKKEKKKPVSGKAERPKVNLSEQIKNAAAGLWYISETDAEIFPFTGSKADSVSKENLLSQIDKPPEAPVEERGFDEMFARFIKIQDWFGDEEKATAEKFAALKSLLEKNLTNLKVFKVGRIELDIYFVGLDKEGNLAGIRTKAVET
jgi:hypothetical protein